MGYVIGRAQEAMDFDRLIELIVRTFPGTKVVAADYYAARIEKQKRIAKELGLPIPNAVIKSTIDVYERVGLQRHIAVPINDRLTLDCRIRREAAFCVAPPFKSDDVQPFVELLQGYGLLVEIEASP